MQFVSDGPDIPDALLQAHEEGRVVFFCGAGISYPAGLPGFRGLVEKIYQLNGTAFLDIENEAFQNERYDVTLDLLERRLPNQRRDVRVALAKALKPKLSRKGAIDTHAALLQLARDRAGAVRLVTTNFDRVFYAAAKRTKQHIRAYTAPMLPIPKNSRWNGIVYLHGLLPAKDYDLVALNRLVVTSGDFGLAYLTERWAARFVSELFRNYVVCFVGYSINDPVLRYMMDALAADRMLGEITPQFWALADCEPGQEARKTNEWKAKGVTPILYSVPPDSRDHSALHRTLQVWCEVYRDGVIGKERIVVDHARARPSASTREDDFVGRMLWALSDLSGLPAKRFAEFDPVPSLEWLLEAFTLDRFGHTDLGCFGVPSHNKIDEELRYSLVHRPTPYTLAPPMRLVTGGVTGSNWDKVMFQLGRWLLRHLNDPRLVLWIAERGGHTHWQWAQLIEQKLDELSQLEREGKASELERIRAHAPDAIPVPLMRILWRLVLSKRVKLPRDQGDILQWKRRLKREGLTATLRLELRELLSPKVRLRKPFRWGGETETARDPAVLRELVHWELVLTADRASFALRQQAEEQWQAALPALLDDMQQLLRDALDLRHELGAADEHSDGSFWHLPSISDHWQNRNVDEWVLLIELLRDSWIAVHRVDGVRAARVATAWFELPYPTFKRLALFAASQEGCIAPSQWVEWLTADDGKWLWSPELHRETMRLLAQQGCRLDGETLSRLEQAIIKGPPRSDFRDDLEPEEWQYELRRAVWLRLSKLRASGACLGDGAAKQLEAISKEYPHFEFKPHEREEFLHWMSGTGAPDYSEQRTVDTAPRKRHELVQWLVKPQGEQDPRHSDTWRDVCRTRFFHSLLALCDLARSDMWPEHRWREALQTWSDDDMVLRSWRFAAPLVEVMPDEVALKLAHSTTWWLKAASKSINSDDRTLLQMCQRFLELELGAVIRDGDDYVCQNPVDEAINHPVGHLAEAVINLWLKREPSDGDGLPESIESVFSQLCAIKVRRFRHGRVLLASRLIALFRVDRTWTVRHLLPLFDWAVDKEEAKAVWEGFLWSPRLHHPLLVALKPHFLDSANYYFVLGEHRRQFAAVLVYAALNSIEGYTVSEFRSAMAALPQEALEEAAQALYQAVEGATDRSEEFWRYRVQPFWKQVWPKHRDLRNSQIAEALARLAIAARGEFPAAFSAVEGWLQPIEYPDYLIHLLDETDLCRRFPHETLRFLNAIVGEHSWLSHELHSCLNEISRAAPDVEQDASYRKLREYSRW